MRNEAMMTKRMMFKGLGVLAGVMLVGPLLPREAKAVHAEKLKEMMDKNDHAGLADYYKKQADEARHKADDMKNMTGVYLKKYPKNTYAKYAEKMADRYLDEAKEYDDLAEVHNKLAKGGK